MVRVAVTMIAKVSDCATKGISYFSQSCLGLFEVEYCWYTPINRYLLKHLKPEKNYLLVDVAAMMKRPCNRL